MVHSKNETTQSMFIFTRHYSGRLHIVTARSCFPSETKETQTLIKKYRCASIYKTYIMINSGFAKIEVKDESKAYLSVFG